MEMARRPRPLPLPAGSWRRSRVPAFRLATTSPPMLSGRDAVVIAGDPDPIPSGLDPRQGLALVAAEPVRDRRYRESCRRARTTRRGPIRRTTSLQDREGLPGVVGRQHHSPAGERRALLEMEVGHEQRIVVGQIEAPDRSSNAAIPARPISVVVCLFLSRCRHARASSRSVASASARISSASSL